MKKLIIVFVGSLFLMCSWLKASPISNYEREIIAAVLILEADNQGREGMHAVMNVIYNRAEGNLKRVVSATVKHKHFTSINSVTGVSRPDYGPILAKAYKSRHFGTALDLVRDMESGKLVDITFGANHYHAAGGRPPYWVKEMQYLTTIGKHHFYTDEEVSVQATNP